MEKIDDLSMIEDDSTSSDKKQDNNVYNYNGKQYQLDEEQFAENMAKVKEGKKGKSESNLDLLFKTYIKEDINHEDLGSLGESIMESAKKDKGNLSEETISKINEYAERTVKEGNYTVNDPLNLMPVPTVNEGEVIDDIDLQATDIPDSVSPVEYLEGKMRGLHHNLTETVKEKNELVETNRRLVAELQRQRQVSLIVKNELTATRKRLRQIEALTEHLLVTLRNYPEIYKKFENIIRLNAKKLRNIKGD